MADPAQTPISLSSFLGSSLQALVRSQAAAGQATAELLQELGFEPRQDPSQPLQAKTFQFRFQRQEPDPETGVPTPREVEVDVPLLTLLQVPALTIEAAEIDFEVQVTNVEPAPSTATGEESYTFDVVPARWTSEEATADSPSTLRFKLQVRAAPVSIGMDQLLSVLATGHRETL